MHEHGAIQIGSRREIFDHLLIDRMEGATLRMHPPTPAGTALAMDAPWEGPFSFYTTVLRYENTYLMYYRGWTHVSTEGDHAPACTCVATSPDGIQWTRPDLGLVEIEGFSRNNIILHELDHGDVCHNFCPFIDPRPGILEDERFKALGGTWRGTGGLVAYASADGIRWRRLVDAPVVTHPTFAFDSQNVAFWSEAEDCYVCFYRIFVPVGPKEERIRWVARQTSPDLIHWSDPVEMVPVGGPIEHMYTQQTIPYARAPHIYISLAARFMPKRQAIDGHQAKGAGFDDRYWHDCSDGVLMTTRAGSSTYTRTFMESYVRPGIGYENWGSRSNYPAFGIVPTGDSELSIYVNRRYAQPAAFVERMTLRPDGFCSVNAGYDGGQFLTKPVVFEGKALEINYATSAAGSVRVEIQDASGVAIDGFALAEATEIIGDEVSRVVSWRAGSDVGALAGQPIRLRIVLRDADLYAIRFAG